MPREVSKKTFYLDLTESFTRQRSHSYNLRPRNKYVNYNNTNSYRSKTKRSLQALQLDLTESSSSKKSRPNSPKIECDEPTEIVTHFVNVNFSENSLVTSTQSQDSLHQNNKDSDLENCIESIESKNQVDAKDDQYEEQRKSINLVKGISTDTMSREEYETEYLDEVEVEDSCSADNIEKEGLIAENQSDQVNVSDIEEDIQSTSLEEEEAEDEEIQNSNSANNMEGDDEQTPDNHSEETFISDTEEYNESTNLNEQEEFEETEDNTNALNNDEEDFRPNYSASAFDHRELIGNPNIFHLARWASQARVQNNIDPLIDYDIDAIGDGAHIHPNILEIHISILHEDEEESYTDL